MGDSQRGKSIWKKFEKHRVEAYHRINKKTSRAKTNLLEWERSWKKVKILMYPTRFANERHLGARENSTVEDLLAENTMLPDVDVGREYWTPAPEEMIELL